MLKMHLAAGLAATALMTAAAVAQTSTTTAPTTGTAGSSTTMSTTGSSGSSGAATMGTNQSSGAAASGQLMSQMSPDMMRGSKLMGTDIYGSDNQKIGDLDDVILDRQGKVQAIVVGVGGFLGIGEKNVAIPFDQVQWMTSREVQALNNQNAGTNTAGAGGAAGTNTAGGMTTASGANQPATTGSTGAAGTVGAGNNNDTMPARGMVKMTKADLQNAPEFRFNNDNNRANATGGAAGTNPPAATTRPGTAPAQ